MYALAVGPFREDELQELSKATADAGLTLLSAHGGAEAKRLVRTPSPPPRAVLLSRLADVAAFVGWMRERAGLFSVPVLAIVAHPTEAEFRRAFDAGADDVLVEAMRSVQGGACAAWRRSSRNSAPRQRADSR
jgi:DNA-binding response OmpR family regulator